MFDSGFSEGDPGEQRVQIKDVKPATFRVLVRFMYANEIPQNEMPTQVCADDQGSADQSSFEVFLAAHRYELQELCERAQELVVSTKDSADAVPFLFHIGYLFDGLRAPMVKMAASSCSEVIASQTFLQEHMGHPKFISCSTRFTRRPVVPSESKTARQSPQFEHYL